METINSILKFIGVLITALCLTICVICIIGMVQCNTQQQFVMYTLLAMMSFGVTIISTLSTIDEL